MSQAKTGPRFDIQHPAVRAAARRAGMDVETWVTLRETEHQWPRQDATAPAR